MQRDTAINAAALGIDGFRAEEGHGGGSIGGHLSSGHLDPAKRALMFMLQPHLVQNATLFSVKTLSHERHIEIRSGQFAFPGGGLSDEKEPKSIIS
jgi:hypothetical protein